MGAARDAERPQDSAAAGAARDVGAVGAVRDVRDVEAAKEAAVAGAETALTTSHSEE